MIWLPSQLPRLGAAGGLPRRAMLRHAMALATIFGPARAAAQTEGEAAPADDPEAAPPEPVGIGLAHPVDGPFSLLGIRCRLGAHVAISRINAAGGIASLGGAPLVAVEGDIAPVLGGAAEAVRALNEAGAAAIVGAATTPLSREVAEAAAQVSLPHVLDAAIGDGPLDREIGRSFRLGPGYGQILDALITLLDGFAALEPEGLRAAAAAESDSETTDAPPPLSVALLRDPGAWGRRVEADLRARSAEPGTEGQTANPIKITSVVDLPPVPEVPGSVRTFLDESAADVIVVIGYAAAQTALLSQLAARPDSGVPATPVVSVLGAVSTSNEVHWQGIEIAEGLVDVTVAPDPAKADTGAMLEAFARHATPFAYDSFMAHEAVMLVADALERAGTTERNALIEAVAASEWESASLPFGPTEFVDGQNTAAVAQPYQVRTGRLVPIGPGGAGLIRVPVGAAAARSPAD